jgi:hypothetical protein
MGGWVLLAPFLTEAQHGFDRFHSIRFEQVVDAVEDFATWVRSRATAAR